jgi:hypothetical protein
MLHCAKSQSIYPVILVYTYYMANVRKGDVPEGGLDARGYCLGPGQSWMET